MGLFDNFKRPFQDEANDYQKGSNKRFESTYTLELIKKTLNTDGIVYNAFNDYYSKNYSLPPITSRRAQIVDNISDGITEFHTYNINDNIINTMVNNIANEVFSDLQIVATNGDEIKELDEEIIANKVRLKLSIDSDSFKDIFKKAFKYDRIGIYIDVKNQNGTLMSLPPYQYKINDNNVTIFIWDGDKVNEMTIEKQYFYEYRLKNDFWNSLEILLDYQAATSAVSREIQIGQSKLAIDKKVWKNNPVNSEFMQIIDVPKGIATGDDGAIKNHMQIMKGNNNLYSLINAAEMKAKQLVATFSLNKKTLGLFSEKQDFASSLPYENDLTAKTINDYRESMEQLFNALVQQITERSDVSFIFGKYSLTSEEAILDSNQKGMNSQTMSVSKRVSRFLDKTEDDDVVFSETIKIKLENNIQMTLEEEIKAGELNLLPPLVPDNIGMP